MVEQAKQQLEVEQDGGELMESGIDGQATIQQLTSRLTAARYTPGAVLPCTVDPQDKSKVPLANPAMAS